MTTKKPLDEWERGALMAMSIMLALHDQPVIAADVLNEMGLANADCSSLDDYDKRNLRVLRREPRAGKLRGLGRGRESVRWDGIGRAK